ncbi:HD domain-containing protein [Tessaracoccus antarcticus]|uniref:HD domain-containing protein n=1 Tax=Tessaracoccus antarcticus TaxID=2479848 RepID=UPI0011C42E66|nr:metal-dependent phosphohydrolase [Tessaracoccus antarcticus]
MNPDPAGLLPDSVAAELLRRWAEPHRHYHDTSHLVNGLVALETLGGSRLELIAFWFHDAVHSNSTPEDERASAALVADLLEGHEAPSDITEIQRLVMLTAGHLTAPDDIAGQRVCDADLSALGADGDAYRRNVEGIRAELPHLTDQEWVHGRSEFLARFLERGHFFGTDRARGLWEAAARANLRDELENLRLANHSGSIGP